MRTRRSHDSMQRTQPLTGCVVLLFLLGMSRSESARSQAAADETEIRKADAEWSHAAQTKNLEKMISFYAEDGSVLPFGAPIATGREQARQLWSHLMSLPGFSLTFTPTKVQVASSGELAYDVGTFLLTLNDTKGTPTSTPGKYVVVWQKQAPGGWKAVADIFNTDR
jgi:ketosteroid isomerase-like protein